MKPNTVRIPTLDMLRGIAALMVVWFHFTSNSVTSSDLLKLSGEYGWLGVEMFFVISGFIIPFALHHASYSVRQYARFVLKRMARLDPPYLASIAIVLILAVLSSMNPGFRGEILDFSWLALLLHLGYANFLFDYPWLNPVYWTLAVELQYYLLVGLAFPLLAGRRVVFLSVLVLTCALSFINLGYGFIFNYLPLFGLGFLTFRLKCFSMDRTTYLLGVVELTVVAALSLGLPQAVAGYVAALVIAFVHFDSRPTRFLGNISYSLYLLHVPIGTRVLHIAERFPAGTVLNMLAPFLALTASIVAAYLFYLLIERPSRRWSASIQYQSERTTTPTLVPSASVSVSSLPAATKAHK